MKADEMVMALAKVRAALIEAGYCGPSDDGTGDPEVNAIDQIVEQRNKLRAALEPFGRRVFNDNGDMTVNTAPPSSEEYIQAYFAMKKTA